MHNRCMIDESDDAAFWRDVAGYEGLYCVSRHGDVMALEKRVPVGVTGGVDIRPARILKPGVLPTGHLRVWLAKDGKKSGKGVHRLVADAFIPNPFYLPLVNHLDGAPAHNTDTNLEWATHARNTKHAFDGGKIALPDQAGSKNSRAQLSEADVLGMRATYAEIGNTAEVARRFGVAPKTAYDICHRRRWTHV